MPTSAAAAGGRLLALAGERQEAFLALGRLELTAVRGASESPATGKNGDTLDRKVRAAIHFFYHTPAGFVKDPDVRQRMCAGLRPALEQCNMIKPSEYFVVFTMDSKTLTAVVASRPDQPVPSFDPATLLGFYRALRTGACIKDNADGTPRPPSATVLRVHCPISAAGMPERYDLFDAPIAIALEALEALPDPARLADVSTKLYQVE